ncbi:hypothetical protein [Rubritalea sp.]|uniref:hypothetical protein n=1 Tax=Rubritalea sp. TaxID=2109375 RepID=UPI003EFAF2A2
MKNILTTALACTALSYTLHADSEYTAYITQEYTDVNGEVQSYPLVSGGSLEGTTNLVPIEGESTRVYLTAFETTLEGTTIEHPLDSVVLGTYIPTANITINAVDYVGSVARTRLDYEYSVTVTVDDLLDGDEFQQAAKQVDFYHSTVTYGPGSTSIADASVVTPVDPTREYTAEGDHDYLLDYYSQVDAGNSDFFGEEVFSVQALPDYGFPDTTIIDEKKILVYPLPNGAIHGINAGEEYHEIPTITFDVYNRYPGGGSAAAALGLNSPQCALLCYAGAPNPDPDLAFVNSNNVTSVANGSESLLSDLVNNSANMTLIKNRVEQIGISTITIQLIQSTGIGIDNLSDVTFVYDPTISINGNINSSE